MPLPPLELPPPAAKKQKKTTTTNGKEARILPSFIVKGAASMMEDAKYMESHLLLLGSGQQQQQHPFSFMPAVNQILDLAARHQIVHLVGNRFLDGGKNCRASSSSSLQTWPTLETQGKMLLLPAPSIASKRRFNFEHLFSTHRTYLLHPGKQLGATILQGGIRSLEEVAGIVEKRIVPMLVQRSEILQKMVDDDGEEMVSQFSIIPIESRGGRSVGGAAAAAVWSISPELHRVIIRTVLLEHILARREGSSSDSTKLQKEDVPNLVRNLQTMIVNMQARID